MVSRVYDRVADHYDEDWSGLYASARTRSIKQIAAQLRNRQRPANTVDLGVGTGNALRDLRRVVPLGLCTGFDVSGGMLARAAQKLDGRVTLIHDDAANAAAHLGGESQDLVLCHFLLSFMDTRCLLGVAHGLLRPGGLFSLATSTQGSLSEMHSLHYPRASRLVGIQRSLSKAGTPRDHRHCLDLLREQGFEIVDDCLQRQTVSFASFEDVRAWALDSGWAASFLADRLGLRKLWGRLAFALAELLIHSLYPVDATSEISIVLARKK